MWAATRPYLAPRIVLATEPAQAKAANVIMAGTVLGVVSRLARKSVRVTAHAMFTRASVLVMPSSREMRARNAAAKMTALDTVNATPNQWHVRVDSAGMAMIVPRLGA